jgi:hypothetical protein
MTCRVVSSETINRPAENRVSRRCSLRPGLGRLWAGACCMKRTEIGQPCVEPSSPLIEALVCDGKPLDLVRQHPISLGPQKAVVHGIELLWVLIVLPDGAAGVLDDVDGEAGALHPLGRVGPAWPVLLVCCRLEGLGVARCGGRQLAGGLPESLSDRLRGAVASS